MFCSQNDTCPPLQEADLQQGLASAPDAPAAAALPPPLSPAERSALLQRLPPDVGPGASAAVAALAGSSPAVSRIQYEFQWQSDGWQPAGQEGLNNGSGDTVKVGSSCS